MTSKSGPGHRYRTGISIVKLAEMFPTEKVTVQWFEGVIWPEGRFCPRCKGTNTYAGTHKQMPYRCRPCKRTFSVRTGTALAHSRLPLKKWVWAIYLEMTSRKGVSSMKLHRDLDVTQTTAWFMLQRIRAAFAPRLAAAFEGPAEADETYIGDLEKNKPAHKKLRAGCGTVGKAAVAGLKDRKTGQVRAEVVESTDAVTLQRFVYDNSEIGATIYTDEAHACTGLIRVQHDETVKRSVGEWVNGMAHTNGLKSFWAWPVQTSGSQYVPPREHDALATLRAPIRGSAQRAGHGHAGAKAARGGQPGGETVNVQEARCVMAASIPSFSPNRKNRTRFHADNLKIMRGINSRSVKLITPDPPFNKVRAFHATHDSLADEASFRERWSWDRDVHADRVDQLDTDWPLVRHVMDTSKVSYDDDRGLDPFCGCATTLIATERNDRQWVGIDIWDNAKSLVVSASNKNRIL